MAKINERKCKEVLTPGRLMHSVVSTQLRGGHDRKRREREPEVLGFSEQLQEKSKMNLAL